MRTFSWVPAAVSDGYDHFTLAQVEIPSIETRHIAISQSADGIHPKSHDKTAAHQSFTKIGSLKAKFHPPELSHPPSRRSI